MTVWVTGRDQVLNLLGTHPLLHIRQSLGNISSCFWFNFKRKPCWQNLKITGWYLPHCLNGRYTSLRTHRFSSPSAPKQVQLYPRLRSCASAETAETVWKHSDTQCRTHMVGEGLGLVSVPVLKIASCTFYCLNSNYEKSEGAVKVIMVHFLWGLLILFCTMLKKVAFYLCLLNFTFNIFFFKLNFTGLS